MTWPGLCKRRFRCGTLCVCSYLWFWEAVGGRGTREKGIVTVIPEVAEPFQSVCRADHWSSGWPQDPFRLTEPWRNLRSQTPATPRLAFVSQEAPPLKHLEAFSGFWGTLGLRSKGKEQWSFERMMGVRCNQETEWASAGLCLRHIPELPTQK